MNDRLGENLIAAILEEKKFPQGVSADDLNHGAKAAYKYISEYVNSYGKFPPAGDVVDSTGVTLPAVYPVVEAAADKIRRKSLSRTLDLSLRGVVSALNANDPDEAASLLKRAADTTPTNRKHLPLDYRSTGGSRMESYLELAPLNGLRGYATPWGTFNDAAMGLVNGELVVFAAYYGTGKSFLCCVLADHLMNQAAKVLMVTMEMPADKIARRTDAIRHRIPMSLLRRSLSGADPAAVDRWRKGMLQDSEKKGNILIADKKMVSCASDIMGLVRDYEPTVVIVDGGYRLQGKGSGRWETTANTIEDLQLFAEESDIPWVVTTQMGDSSDTGKESKKPGKINAWKVRYGKEWLIDPDVVCVLAQTSVQKELRQMEIHIHKLREGDSDKPYFITNWNLDSMDFSEIVAEDEVEETEAIVF